MEPTQAIAAARYQNLDGWRLPTVAELITLTPGDPAKVTGIGFVELEQRGFAFGRSVGFIWTADSTPQAAVVMDVSRTTAIRAGSSQFAILPVRTIPVWLAP